MAEEEKGLLAQLQKDVADMKEREEMLLQVVDKKLLAQYYAKNSKKLPTEVKLNMLGDRTVKEWLMKENKVFKDPVTQRWIETQTVLITLFAEGDKVESIVEMPYVTFVRDYQQVNSRIISSTKDEATDSLILKVARLSDGKEFDIGVAFVN